MDRKEIIIDSKWKSKLKNPYFVNNSDTIVIMLPGRGYTVNAPLFYYLTGMCFELEYDVLQINYGYQMAQETYCFEDYPTLLTEIKAVVHQLPKYKKIILVGKSMGTFFLNDLEEYSNALKIFLTPTDKILDRVKDLNDLYIYGSHDRWLKKNMSRLALANSLCLSGAGHSLTTGDLQTDLEYMKKIIKSIREYIA